MRLKVGRPGSFCKKPVKKTQTTIQKNNDVNRRLSANSVLNWRDLNESVSRNRAFDVTRYRKKLTKTFQLSSRLQKICQLFFYRRQNSV